MPNKAAILDWECKIKISGKKTLQGMGLLRFRRGPPQQGLLPPLHIQLYSWLKEDLLHSSTQWPSIRGSHPGDLAECGWDLAEWLEHLTASAIVATVLNSIPASSDTVESEGRQIKQCWISYIKRKKCQNTPLYKYQEIERLHSMSVLGSHHPDAATYRCWWFRKRDKTWHN
jgi:hypothetical protein